MPLHLHLFTEKYFFATERPTLLIAASCWLLSQVAYAQLPVPEGLNPGDKYHLIFNSSSSTNATSNDISSYNTIVQDNADTVGIGQSEGVTWKALASTSSVHARDNAVIGAMTPVYNMNLDLVATGYVDMWDGSLSNSLGWNESGAVNLTDAWTGTSLDGTAAIGFTLGDIDEDVAWCGTPNPPSDKSHRWLTFITPPITWDYLTLYALSEELTVGPSAATLAGDYNHDGFIDAADYTVWRDTLGSTYELVADGNSDGAINIADYTLWKNHFGNVVGSGGSVSPSAIPEPAAGILGLITLLGFVTMRRPRPNLVV